MKILITGSNGFVGRNLVSELRNRGYTEILEYKRDTPREKLDEFTRICDFVFHLAGVNRPKEEADFMKGNFGFTSELLELLEKNENKAPVLITSSIQAELDNPYGKSKKAGEDLMFEYSKNTGAEVLVYRFSNLFGKWSKPNYNTVVATFCYNIAREIPIQINNREAEICLCYIDDVVDELIRALEGNPNKQGDYGKVAIEENIKLGDLADLLISFRESRETLMIPKLTDSLTKKLYSTYISFLPKEDFAYDLLMHENDMGSFTEFIKTKGAGQVSINVSKPNIVKGQHWHHTKFEKFLVVSGLAKISFRQVYDSEVIEYTVSGEELKVVDIPPGYTHSITNIGDKDLVTVMWANELYNPKQPDTHEMEV